jgi:hypothetical protein
MSLVLGEFLEVVDECLDVADECPSVAVARPQNGKGTAKASLQGRWIPVDEETSSSFEIKGTKLTWYNGRTWNLVSTNNGFQAKGFTYTLEEDGRITTAEGDAWKKEGQASADKEQRKHKIAAFRRALVQGCPCTLVKEGSGDRCSAICYIDKTFQHMIIGSTDNQPEVKCPLAGIQDTYSFVEDGANVFPTDVLDSLGPEEHNLLVMVVYRCSRGQMFRFCLLTDSAESRESLLECLNVLYIMVTGKWQTTPHPDIQRTSRRSRTRLIEI